MNIDALLRLIFCLTISALLLMPSDVPPPADVDEATVTENVLPNIGSSSCLMVPCGPPTSPPKSLRLFWSELNSGGGAWSMLMGISRTPLPSMELRRRDEGILGAEARGG